MDAKPLLRHLFGIAEAAAFCGAAFSVAALFGRWNWAADVFTHLQCLLAVCFLLYAGIEILRRRRLFIALSLAFAVLDAAPVVWMFCGVGAVRAAAPYGTARLRVLQANVLTSNTNAPALLALVEREDPDVILLQEPNERWLRALAPILARYPSHAALPREDNYGIAAFCKDPLARVEIFSLGDPIGAPGARVRLSVGGKALTCYSVHTPAPYNEYTWVGRNEYMRLLAEEVAGAPGAKLVAGDFNNTPWTPSSRAFAREAGLCDATLERGILCTWPTRTLPGLRIPLDHCFHSPEVGIAARRRGPKIGSDHFPVILDVVL